MNMSDAWEECNWTKSRYFGFIRSCLRRAWSKYPVKFKILSDARRPYSGEDKRTKWEYQCHKCNEWYKSKEVQVDHINPVGSLKEYEDLPRFVATLFCSSDNLQVLCSECHKLKTAEDRKK